MIRLKWHIGDVARKVRESKGLTQDDVVAATGLRPNTISDFENGKSNYKAETAKLIAVALKSSPEELASLVPGIVGVSQPGTPPVYQSESPKQQKGGSDGPTAGGDSISDVDRALRADLLAEIREANARLTAALELLEGATASDAGREHLGDADRPAAIAAGDRRQPRTADKKKS